MKAQKSEVFRAPTL